MMEKLNRANQVFAKSNASAIGIVLGTLMTVFAMLLFIANNLLFGFIFLGLGIILALSFICASALGKKDLPPQKSEQKHEAIFKRP